MRCYKKSYDVDISRKVFDYKKEEECPRCANQKQERPRRKNEYNTDRTSRASILMSSPFHKIRLEHSHVFLSLKVPRNLFFSEIDLFGG